LQVIFNILRQKPLEKLFPLARQRGIAIIVRLPLASGLLSGRWTDEKNFGEKDHRNFNRDGAKFNVGETFAGVPLSRGLELVEQLRALVPQGMTMAQFALRWCLDCPEVTSVIPGATRPDQARQNAAAAEFPRLGDELHEQLRRWYDDEVAAHIRGKY
jgi:aryl-alcohol dehydrogenase-like predicted oxidoreductase